MFHFYLQILSQHSLSGKYLECDPRGNVRYCFLILAEV
jgi:hypothetical protein